MAELLAERQKLGPFLQVLPQCTRLLTQGSFHFLFYLLNIIFPCPSCNTNKPFFIHIFRFQNEQKFSLNYIFILHLTHPYKTDLLGAVKSVILYKLI
jgi:hypothetical protein